MTDDFFDEQEEQSAVKTAIVVKYFPAWARIMVRKGHANKVAYLDLFAGPGRFRDNTPSTPILILQQAINERWLGQRLIAKFNDADANSAATLQREISALHGIEFLSTQPTVSNVALEGDLPVEFRLAMKVPSLSFIDPWGYKGLTRQIIGDLIRNRGCEVIFFFNYNRINAAIDNSITEPLISSMFGDERLPTLRSELRLLAPRSRETRVMRELGETMQRMGAEYLIPFRFSRPNGRSSHYICFVSKHPLGYMIMKDVMADLGVKDEDGVPKFEFIPRREGAQLSFDVIRPFLQLTQSLLKVFAGQTLSVEEIVERHNVGTPFIERNYKRALMEMETRAVVQCSPARRRRGTMADSTKVTFPAPNLSSPHNFPSRLL